MKQTENSPRSRQDKKLLLRALFIRMLLVLFLLVITTLVIMNYSISRYKQDYFDNVLRSNDVLGAEISAQSEIRSSEEMFDEYIPATLNKIAEQLNVYIYFFDGHGKCLICTESTQQAPEEVTLNQEMLSQVQKKGIYLSDAANAKLNQKLSEPLLCRGIPVELTLDGAPQTFYMFSYSHVRALEAYTNDVVTVAVILLVGMAILSLVFNLYSIRLKSRQRDSLIAAMRQYARGDFRVSIKPELYTGSEFEETAFLIEEISSQTRRAEESSRQFVSNVSHELRTPMTIIKGFVEGILDGTVPKNKRMEYLFIVSQEVQRLQMLVTSMLNLTKFDNGTIQMNYQQFSLNDTVFRTVLMFGSRLEKKNITVDGLDAKTLRVNADPDLIGQVIYNLVENAVKFVNENGTITFTFQEEDHAWIFAVRNTGSGIPKDELPKIFERFYKSDASRSADKTGLGLGLDITRRIIHLHQAEIRVRSEENAYTEFEIRLPRVELTEQREHTDSKN